MGNAHHYIVDTRERHAIAPHLVLGTIRMGACQPFADLVIGLGFLGGSHHPAMGLEDLAPELHFFISRIFCAKIAAPPVRETLESAAFQRCKSADNVAFLHSPRTSGRHGWLQFLVNRWSKFRIGSGIESISANTAAYRRWVFVVSGHQGWSLFFFHLRVAAGGHSVGFILLNNRHTALIGIRGIAGSIDTPSDAGFVDIVASIFRSLGSQPYIYGTDQGLIIAACAIGAGYRWCNLQRPGVSGILGVVLIDSRGLIWVGTRDGLNLYNKPNDIVQVFSREQGIPNDMICGLAEDSYKHIWVTTAGGVCRLVPQAGTNEDGEYSVYVYNYTQADGLQGMEFNPNSICTARDGKVYMGGLNGLNWINIGETEARNRETKVIFSELVFEGKRIGVGESIGDRVILTSRINDISTLTLPSYMRSFAIEMSVSNYYRCDHPQFMYMLEGLDGVWRPGDPLIHGVRFNNLPSGKYVLHVKATNDLGQMTEDEHVLTIVIERPWWLSWWAITFYVIIILLVLGAIFFGIPWLRRKIVSSKEERLLYEKRNEALRSVMLLLVAPINKIKEQVRKLEPLLTTPAQREIADTIRHIEDELHEELKNAQNEDVQAMLPDELRDHSAVDEAFDEEGAPLANDVEVDNASNLVPLASKRDRPKRSIYLVDSDKDIAEYIADSLKNSFDFTLFATGAELLAAMAERRPDLILAYEALPDMRGSELCVQIKREKSLARIPFVLMLETAMQASEMEKHGITVAADDYVIHFFDLVALRVRCSKLMGEPVSDESPMEEAMLTADAMLDGVGELLRHHVREYVKVNISNPKLPLEDLCDAIGVPMPQLFRKIETLTGSTPAEFIRDIRLAEAATLFKSTDIMPIDVALEVGFPNIATFNRFFSEKYGMTPMEFRDKNHGEA